MNRHVIQYGLQLNSRGLNLLMEGGLPAMKHVLPMRSLPIIFCLDILSCILLLVWYLNMHGKLIPSAILRLSQISSPKWVFSQYFLRVSIVLIRNGGSSIRNWSSFGSQDFSYTVPQVNSKKVKVIFFGIRMMLHLSYLSSLTY